MNNKTKSIIIASLGTLIEYYDYSIFSMFLPFFAPVFFPAKSSYESLVIGFYAVLITQIARPLGGLLFGAIGDKFGRKRALLLSIYGIALATLFIGILPGYNFLGLTASILLILIRAVQMLCYGGEYSGAGIYVVELVKTGSAGRVGSLLSAMALLGSVAAALIGMVITKIDSTNPNWRLSFLIGGAIGLVAIFLRRNMRDSLVHTSPDSNNHDSIITIIKRYPRQLLTGICIGGFITMPFTTVLAFINPILKTKGYLSSDDFMLLQLLLSSIAVVTLIIAGFLADKFTPVKVMRYAALGLIIFAAPLSMMLSSDAIKVVVIAEIILIVLNELLLGPSNAFLKQLFPARSRYRGVAFSFCLGMSLIGGLTPVVENYLYQHFHSLTYIAVWLIAVSCLTLYFLFSVALLDEH